MADRLAREARREAEANRMEEGEQRSSEQEHRRAAVTAAERMAGFQPTASSSRMSEDTQAHHSSRLRSQPATPAQPAMGQAMPSHRKSQTATQAGARVSSAPETPKPPRFNDLRPEDVPQPSNRAAFPHAFERWEFLSSHWEGLTSYWLHKLEDNQKEIARVLPGAPAMQRQIQDLSAAGANLFHALVELQRLRNSSERKFKRWFSEAKAEQEKWLEAQADLQGQLNAERLAKDELQLQLEAARRGIVHEKNRASEDRKELYIAKNEARRAWESLGERNVKDLECLKNLREGLPTIIGGEIHVVPLSTYKQDMERRPATADSPQYHQARSQQSQHTQQPQQQYQPIVPDVQYQADEPSPTNTDPFTEAARAGQQLHHEPDLEQLGPEDRQPYLTGSTPASSSTARTFISPQEQRRDMSPQGMSPLSPNVTTTRPMFQSSQLVGSGSARDQPELFYQQLPGKVYLHSSPGSGASGSKTPTAVPAQEAPGLGSRPSFDSNTSEGTEYEVDQHGNVRRDAQGRPVVYRNPNRSTTQNVSHVSSEEYDTAADVARERELGARYGVGVAPPPVPRAPTSSAEAMASFATSTVGDVDDMPAGYQAAEPADYEGAGYGDWEGLQSRHHHPTRLSDVLEEDERSRTTAE
ncbi:hypothetical protein AUEXF2481DRAFT_4960 [Aureobasidium subglaciale EXF-2481]|uniref:Uncharacterized protein n=1 Tax=Aureobasidium subglaciale (strain EXF-2481) TaxID=1043005 RepID=A0A074Z938_AURSE|nr:uncharacterized protein AUEXF2481DRAFT_4960 [Aureobasidium subglaciale EXF-2481]KAI5204982.1 hypothetical protein E4T38_04539 [Aureobasidium subglaciale]KAI5223896.1 hypothetical protein E4T40_04315 [Aureobasidium subglaciale]KAI5227437.1 hypothetical protein E4T41_04397 [Aureobasidium subglaciale]KAI5262675.1 hypothetical protein E4T46_04283 [Aureobasidium subglaciale]KEQ95346.1 hypothetical protein AUEXF2481DRAFT_4960 [Aureobasidium subglaciale EXF-2481]